MARVLWTVALMAFVVWGATSAPGHPFSWTMYSGSSKAFLWLGEGQSVHVAAYEELHLAPDNHYLSVTDLQKLVAERGDLPPLGTLQGFVIGSKGSWLFTSNADSGRLTWGRLSQSPGSPRSPGPSGDQDLLALSKAVGRLGCRQA